MSTGDLIKIVDIQQLIIDHWTSSWQVRGSVRETSVDFSQEMPLPETFLDIPRGHTTSSNPSNTEDDTRQDMPAPKYPSTQNSGAKGERMRLHNEA